MSIRKPIQFVKNVDLRNKKAMVEFLEKHFRYNTMNSWNRSTSYAQNLKIDRVLPNSLVNKGYEIMDQGDVYSSIRELLKLWAESHKWNYQAGFNGRSGGYLVMYKGGAKTSDYKTTCDTCGKLTWYEHEQECHVDGCDGMLRPLLKPVVEHFTYPGKGIDDDVVLSELSMSELEERVRLVQGFDALCDAVVDLFIDYCNKFSVEEVEIPVIRTRKMLAEIPV